MDDTAAIRAYLAAGGCPDAPDGQGRSPLAFAAGYGRAAAARLLLDAGACAAAASGTATPLHRSFPLTSCSAHFLPSQMKV